VSASRSSLRTCWATWGLARPRDHLVEDLLGGAAADGPPPDQDDEFGQEPRRHGELPNRETPLLEDAQNLAHNPIGGGLVVTRPGGDGLVVIGQGAVGGQYSGVVAWDSVLFDEAFYLSVGQLGAGALDPGVVDAQQPRWPKSDCTGKSRFSLRPPPALRTRPTAGRREQP
jgi:hypothetical protein